MPNLLCIIIDGQQVVVLLLIFPVVPFCLCFCSLFSEHFLQNLFHKNNSRRRAIYPTEFVQGGVKHMLLRKRMHPAKTGNIAGCVKMTVHHWIAALTIWVHCNKLKPTLMEENKWARLEMALSFVDPADPMKLQDMRDRVHLDEKWFFLTWKKRDTSFSLKRKNQDIVCNTSLT